MSYETDRDQMIYETVDSVINTCSTSCEVEECIRRSWEYDDQRRRSSIPGGFEAFRGHVLSGLRARLLSARFARLFPR